MTCCTERLRTGGGVGETHPLAGKVEKRMKGSGGEGRSAVLHVLQRGPCVHRAERHGVFQRPSFLCQTRRASVMTLRSRQLERFHFIYLCVCVLFKGSVPQQCWLQCTALLFITNTRSVSYQISYSPVNALMKTYWTH